jgi:hypothetical protein
MGITVDFLLVRPVVFVPDQFNKFIDLRTQYFPSCLEGSKISETAEAVGKHLTNL